MGPSILKRYLPMPSPGMKYFFVEQDKCPGSPFDSITTSIAYIKKNLVQDNIMKKANTLLLYCCS